MKIQQDPSRGFRKIEKLPHGVHIGFIYENINDLLQAVSLFFKFGLERNEMCLWALHKGLTLSKAKAVLKKTIKDLDKKIDIGQIKFKNHKEWHVEGENFDVSMAIKNLNSEGVEAFHNGWNGLRVSGNPLEFNIHWDVLRKYEETATQTLHKHKIIALCAYPANQLSLNKMIEIVNSHPFTLTRKGSAWVIEENLTLNSIRTIKRDLKIKIKDLQKFKNLSINRELKMVELKQKIQNLKNKLKRYKNARENKN